jgi:hypothetical protein
MGDCGGTGGYPLLVLSKKGNSYKVISETITGRQPIIVSSTKTKGWRNIIVSAAGNSEHPYTESVCHYVALKWNGTRYPSGIDVLPATNLRSGEVINGDVIVAQPAHAPGAVLPAISLE